MIKIFIDEQELVMRSEPVVKLNYDSAVMKSVEGAKAGQDVVVEVEADPENSPLFIGEGYLHVAQRFNATQHTGRIEHDGSTIFSGEAILLGVEKSSAASASTMKFTIRLRDSGAQWAKNACETMLSKTAIDEKKDMIISLMKQGWDDMTSPIQFFPVHRDSYRATNEQTLGVEIRRMRSIDDYHPFLRVRSVMDSIFTTEGGYEIESDFLDSEAFNNLYISGAYTGQDSDAAKSAMNFCVKKLSDETATASNSGRVYISPSISVNSVKNLVDIESLESDTECFSYGDCFTLKGSTLTFTPLTSVDVGFEYRLVFKAGYYVESRSKLKTFDTYWLDSSSYITAEVVNTIPDEKGNPIMVNFNYMPIVFDHVDGTSYRLMANINGAAGQTILGEWSDRTGSISTSGYGYSTTIDNATLLYSRSGSAYKTLEDDWALYYGSDSETGEMIIDISIRTAPETLTPDSPKTFNMLFVQGAQSGTQFTLMEGTTVTPYFASYPGAGSIVDFEDVAQHGVWQSQFLESIKHLYNLRFYSDNLAKKVYVEPAEKIYSSDEKWDWTEKIVKANPITFEDVATENYKVHRWAYIDKDGFTNRTKLESYDPYYLYPTSPEKEPVQTVENSWSEEYGEWSVEIESYAAKQTTLSDINPIYSPTQNTTTGLPIVGDRDDTEMINTLDFAPRILQYTGQQVYDENDYVPHLTFFDKDEKVSLCFEDREGVRGLNQYYCDEIARNERGQYVTLSLKVEPFEVADLFSPLEGRASVLSTFLLTIEGEVAECRLEKIVDYDVEKNVGEFKFLIVK
ncbi:MAG: hypothetical protein SNH79_03520 [Rikenellaceae bacterium]